MKAQLAIHFVSAGGLWAPVGRFDSVAAELADGHYSRQSPGHDQYMPPGECVAFVHHGERGRAVWGVVRNVFRGVWRWRNTIFRNASSTRSSELVASATFATYAAWLDRYGALPAEPLTTEVDIEATRARRSKRHEPGHCYRVVGWREVARRGREHGRPATVVLEAPR